MAGLGATLGATQPITIYIYSNYQSVISLLRLTPPPPISFLILSNIIHLDRQLWSLWWHKPHPIQNVLHCSQTRRRGCLFTLHQLAKGVECSRDQVTEIQVNLLSAAGPIRRHSVASDWRSPRPTSANTPRQWPHGWHCRRPRSDGQKPAAWRHRVKP